MHRPRSLIVGLALAAGLATAATAQQPAAPAAPAGVRGDLLGQLDDAASKILALAEAIPQENFSWRPGAGVRSVSEVFMHVASGNFFIAQMAGAAPPATPMPRGAETTVSDKAQVLDWLRRSFDYARGAIRGTTEADLDKTVQMFGRPTSARNVLLVNVTHCHEHLGQLIAYARTNGVVPPWSAAGGQ